MLRAVRVGRAVRIEEEVLRMFIAAGGRQQGGRRVSRPEGMAP